MKKERGIFYKFIKFLFYIPFKLYFNPKVISEYYIPEEGPTIIACNHISMGDPCLVVYATKRIVHFLAKDKHYDKFYFKPLFKKMHCIRVNTKFKDGLAMKESLEVLDKKQLIGIFPEGTRNLVDDNLLPFKFGTVKMAYAKKAMVVPCAIIGKFKFRSGVKIVFGKPYRVRSNNMERENEKLYKKVKELKEIYK